MFLPTIQSPLSLNLSNIYDNSMLKKYETFLSYEESKNNFANLSAEDTYTLFKTFMSIIKGEFSKEILLIEQYNDKSHKDFVGRTCYKSENDNTVAIMKQVLSLIHYTHFIFENKSVLFFNIKIFLTNMHNEVNNDYHDLVKFGYDIFDKNDCKKVLSYFWSYDLTFRISQNK